MNPNDFLMAEGGKTAKFEQVGDTIKGVIVSAKMQQQTDIETGAPKTWSNGDPIMQLVIDVQTEDRATEDDDGIRRLYVKGGNYEVASGEGTSMLVAVREAVKAAGANGLDEGGTIAVKHTGLGKKKNPAYSAPKLYKAKYEAPKAGAGVGAEDLF